MPAFLQQDGSGRILSLPSHHGRFRRVPGSDRAVMFVSPAFSKPALLRRQDRRDRQRFPFPSSVTVDGRPAQGRDLSATGISVFVPVPQVGAVVQVAVPTVEGAGQAIETAARVVRLDRTPSGYIVGLEFLATENTENTEATENTESREKAGRRIG